MREDVRMLGRLEDTLKVFYFICSLLFSLLRVMTASCVSMTVFAMYTVRG